MNKDCTMKLPLSKSLKTGVKQSRDKVSPRRGVTHARGGIINPNLDWQKMTQAAGQISTTTTCVSHPEEIRGDSRIVR